MVYHVGEGRVSRVEGIWLHCITVRTYSNEMLTTQVGVNLGEWSLKNEAD